MGLFLILTFYNLRQCLCCVFYHPLLIAILHSISFNWGVCVCRGRGVSSQSRRSRLRLRIPTRRRRLRPPRPGHAPAVLPRGCSHPALGSGTGLPAVACEAAVAHQPAPRGSQSARKNDPAKSCLRRGSWTRARTESNYSRLARSLLELVDRGACVLYARYFNQTNTSNLCRSRRYPKSTTRYSSLKEKGSTLGYIVWRAESRTATACATYNRP